MEKTTTSDQLVVFTMLMKCKNGNTKNLFPSLFFADRPENTRLTASTYKPIINQQITLTCTTSAKPPVQYYKFFQNNQLIQNSSSSIYTFTITQRGKQVFSCIPHNVIGDEIVISPVTLDVQCKYDIVVKMSLN